MLSAEPNDDLLRRMMIAQGANDGFRCAENKCEFSLLTKYQKI